MSKKTAEIENTPEFTFLNVPDDVMLHVFSFLPWQNLNVVADVCVRWEKLSKRQKAHWQRKLLEEKHLSFDPKIFPEGFLDSHPIDFRALYFKLRNIPATKLCNPSALAYYAPYVVMCALVGGKVFWDALAIHGKPRNFLGNDSTSYYIVDAFAISGDLESLKKFDQGSLKEFSIILEGAVKGGSLDIIEWVFEQIEDVAYAASLKEKCFGWAVEFCRHEVLTFLQTKYQQKEPVREDQPWYCLDKAICSNSVSLVRRFIRDGKIPAHFLHLAAQNNADEVFWYGVRVLGLSINQEIREGLMPIHRAAESGNLRLFRQLADHPDCCLMLKNPEGRLAEHQHAYYRLLRFAARRTDAKIIQVLHTEYNVDLNVVDPETGNILAHESCAISRINVFRYLVLSGNVNWEHSNNKGETVSQLHPLQDDTNPFFYNQNTFYYYVLHARVIEYLIKAISKEDDANEFLVKLMQYHTDHPADIMACLALAIVFKDDEILCRQYLQRGRDVSRREFNASIEIMKRMATMMRDFGTIDTSCLESTFQPWCFLQ